MELCACQFLAGIAVIRDYLACFVSHMKVSDVRIMYSVWYWRDSHVGLIVRLLHVPQFPGGGDAKVAPAFQWVV